MSHIIEIRNLNYIYKREEESSEPVSALCDVTLNIEEGSFVSIIGRNGSGKSTLAKSMNALLLPSSGAVYVLGQDTRDENRLWDIRQSVGMVFQNPDNQLVSSIVEDDVAFGPENLGIAPAEIRKRVDDALHAVSMYEERKKAPHLLSGGQKQRVAIAGVIAMRPRCIVLDEPTAMLDPQGRQGVMEVIQKLNKEEKITIVLITHFMDEAALADRIIIMDEGEIRLDGTPAEVFKEVEKIKSYGLSVPIAAEISYRLRQKKINMPEDIIDVEQLVNFVAEAL